MKAGSRHSKLMGDPGEHAVLYRLDRLGWAAGKFDHVGIGLIAAHQESRERIGVSVKYRAIGPRESASVSFPRSQLTLIRESCELAGGVEPLSRQELAAEQQQPLLR